MRQLDLSIGQRLGIGFGVVLTLLAILLGVFVYQNAQISALQDRVSTLIFPRALAAAGVQDAFLHQAIAVRAYALAPDPQRLEEYRQAANGSRTAFRRLDVLPKEPDGLAVFVEISLLAERYHQAADHFVGLVQQSAAADAALAAETETVGSLISLLDRTQAFLDLQARKQQAAMAGVAAAQAATATTFLLVSALTLAVGAATALLTTRAVRRPALRLVVAARAVESGDYGPALALAPATAPAGAREHRRDELAEVSAAFRQMAGEVQRREARLAARNRLSAALGSSILVDRLTAETLQAVAVHVGCQFGAIYVLDPAAATLQLAGSYALDGAAATTQVGEGIPGQAAASGQTVVVRDIPADAPFRVRFGFDDLPPRTIVATPIRFQERVIGVMLLGSLRDLADDAIGYIEHSTRPLGVSLENALARQQIARLAADLREKNEQLQAQNEELQAQSEELQAQSEELQARNDELERQREALAEADRAKDDFLSVASHELRNPITSLKGFAQLALRRARSRPELHEFVDQLRTVDQHADALVTQIDRLLDVSRAKMGRLQVHPKPTELSSLVWRQVKQAQARTAKHQIIVEETNGQIVGCWDHGYLEQAISNLLENAIRYAPDGGAIVVRLQAEGGEARISVVDHGIGIPPDTLPKLFEPYVRGQGAKEVSPNGMGIGLYVTREIVAAHRGRVWVESEPGKGSTFTIALPLSEDGPAHDEE